MPSSCNKDDQSTAQSLTPFFITCSSVWKSTEQPRHCPSKSTITGPESSASEFRHVKYSEFQFQEHDSSSTLSTCQSLYTMADAAKNSNCVQNVGKQHGSDETHGRRADLYQRSSLLYGNGDYAPGRVQLEYNNSMALPIPCTESYFGRLVVAYGPNALIYPPVVGMPQVRVPLPPLQCAESIPVFVNPKQYRAILRRRQIRAKLLAQTKVLNFRKPYLHESRHIHALRRPRGSGGRFLNTKNIKQSKLSFTSYSKDLSHEKLAGDKPGSEAQRSESRIWGAPTPSLSVVTSIFNGGDIFQQPKIRPSTSSFCLCVLVGEDSTPLEAGNRLFLSIDGCERK